MNRTEPHCIVRRPQLVAAAAIFSSNKEVHITHLHGQKGLVFFSQRDDGGCFYAWDKHGLTRNFRHCAQESFVYAADRDVSLRSHIRGPEFDYDLLMSTHGVFPFVLTDRSTQCTVPVSIGDPLRAAPNSELYRVLLAMGRLENSMHNGANSITTMMNAGSLLALGTISQMLDAVVEVRPTPGLVEQPNVVLQSREGKPLPTLILPRVNSFKMSEQQFEASAVSERLLECFSERDLLEDEASSENVIPLHARSRQARLKQRV